MIPQGTKKLDKRERENFFREIKNVQGGFRIKDRTKNKTNMKGRIFFFQSKGLANRGRHKSKMRTILQSPVQ